MRTMSQSVKKKGLDVGDRGHLRVLAAVHLRDQRAIIRRAASAMAGIQAFVSSLNLPSPRPPPETEGEERLRLVEGMTSWQRSQWGRAFGELKGERRRLARMRIETVREYAAMKRR